jgi:DNA-binding transcriptional LysR family regulator
VGPEQVANYPLLLPKSGRTRSRVDEYLAGVEDDLNISMELESSEMIKQFIMAGLGVGFMGISNAQTELRRKALCSIPLAPLPMMRNLGLIYRKDKALSRAALGFIDVVAEFARHVQSDGPLKEAGFPPKTAPKAS